jgi:hypothetical protein
LARKKIATLRAALNRVARFFVIKIYQKRGNL